MSACAGSSTDDSRSFWPGFRPKVWLLRSRRTIRRLFPGRTERDFQRTSPAWSRWIAHGRIGFMSTQRREDHLRLAHRKHRTERWGQVLVSLVRVFFAIAAGQTASPESPAPRESRVSTATNSLSSDRQNQQPIRLVLIDTRSGSPPPGRPSRQRPRRRHFPGYPSIHSSADRARSIRPCRVIRQQ